MTMAAMALMTGHQLTRFVPLEGNSLARIDFRQPLAVFGLADYLVHVAVRDVAHLRDFAVDAVTPRHGVKHVETLHQKPRRARLFQSSQ